MPRSAATLRALTGVTGDDSTVAQQALEHRADDQRVGRAGQLAVVADADALDARGAHLPEQRTRAGARRWRTAAASGTPPAASDGKLTALRMTPVFRIVAQRGGGLDADQFLSFARRRRDVRRGDDLRQLLQAVIRGRLVLEHVERRAADRDRTRSRRPAPLRRSGRRAPC